MTLNIHVCLQHIGGRDAERRAVRLQQPRLVLLFTDVADAGRWDTDDDDDDDADDDDVWDSGAGNDGAVAGSDASSRRDDAAVDGRGHRQRDAGDAGVVHAVKDGSGNGRRAIQNLVADAGPDNDDYLGRGCVTGGRRAES